MIREIKKDELEKLLDLYAFLLKNGPQEIDFDLMKLWDEITQDPNHHIIIAEKDGLLVSTCVCLIVPNLTQKMRPYAFIENVVTHPDYRKNGYATGCLNYAKELAQSKGCYKMMLLTGSTDEHVHKFYQDAGYNCQDKTGYIQWL